MLRRFFILLSILLALFIPSVVAAPSLEVSLDPKTIHADETSELKLQIEWAKSEGVYLFALPDILVKNFQITNHAEGQETFLRNGEEWTRKTFRMQLTPQAPGTGEVPGFWMTYINNATQENAQFTIEPMKVTIKKKPLRLERYLTPWTLGGGTAVLLILALLGYFQHRRRQELNRPPELTSQEKAIREALEILRMQNYGTAESSGKLNRVFLGFLNHFFEIPVSNVSENQLLETLREKSLSSEELRAIERILKRFQETKFTGMDFTETDFKSLQRDLSDYIESKRTVGLPSN